MFSNAQVSVNITMLSSEPKSVSSGAQEPIEFGSIAPQYAANEEASKLVIASYNIRYAAGPHLISGGILRKVGLIRDHRRDRDVALNITRAAEAFRAGKLLPAVDVLTLQEADKETTRSGKHHVARELAEQLNMSWVHVPAHNPRGVPPKKRQWWLDFEDPIDVFDDGDTGIAVLSRYPMKNVTRIDLPWKECAWRPRLSVGVTIQVGSRKVRLFNCHIDPHSAIGGQVEQLQVVLEHARGISEPTIVLGDFNTLSDRKCVETRKLLEAKGFTTPFVNGTATWRGAGIRLHADWIFVRHVKIARWGVARPLAVSDHWPIWAELDLSK